MVVGILTVAASAYQPPNSTLGGSVGLPWTFGGRGEAWFADELSAELGAGTGGTADPVGFDLAFRWRPDFVCFNCEGRALGTLGIGAGGIVEPDFDLKQEWRWAVGPDLVGTFVYWFSPAYGFTISARGGVGPGFVGTEMKDVRPWAFGTLGLAF